NGHHEQANQTHFSHEPDRNRVDHQKAFPSGQSLLDVTTEAGAQQGMLQPEIQDIDEAEAAHTVGSRPSYGNREIAGLGQVEKRRKDAKLAAEQCCNCFVREPEDIGEEENGGYCKQSEQAQFYGSSPLLATR